MTKLLTSGILFSTALTAEFVGQPVVLGILLSISVILASNSVFLARLFVSGIFFSKLDLSLSYVAFKINPVVSILFTFSTNLLYTVFLTTSFYTTSLRLLKSTGTGANLSMSSLATSVFQLAKFDFNVKLVTSTCDTFLRSAFAA